MADAPWGQPGSGDQVKRHAWPRSARPLLRLARPVDGWPALTAGHDGVGGGSGSLALAIGVVGVAPAGGAAPGFGGGEGGFELDQAFAQQAGDGAALAQGEGAGFAQQA